MPAESPRGALFPNGTPANLTVEVLLVALGEALEHAVQEIKDADIAHTAELSDDPAIREERDDAITNLRAVLIDGRNMLATTYGNTILATYGLEGETPTSPILASQRASWTGLFCVYPDGCRTDADCESDQYCDVNWDDGTGEWEDGMPMCPA